MTILPPVEVGALWIHHGGSLRSLDVAVAIATAESGRNPAAISPDGGYGLFQIQASVWIPFFPITRQALLDPNTNTEIAVYIASKGANFAAWCTMWANPRRDCGHGSITYPQRGSAAYPYLGLASGFAPPPNPGPQGGGSTDPVTVTADGWSGIQEWFGGGAGKRWDTINSASNRVKASKW